MKPEHNYMETMHKQYQLKELCEIPYVMLCDEDEKIMEAYKEKGARPAPLPRFHARALSMYTCVLNMDPNARALDAATRG
jgi:hypothetical protein